MNFEPQPHRKGPPKGSWASSLRIPLPLARRVWAYAESRGITQATALRELIERGLAGLAREEATP